MNRFNQVKFWDQEVENKFQETGLPLLKASLQIREEIEALADWIEANKIRSYLEIGVWTGDLISALDKEFDFEKLAACDIKGASAYDLELKLPTKTNFFHGNMLSPIFINWRQKLGAVDLVLVDADHAFASTARIVEFNQKLNTKYIALCGISEKLRGINGVLPFWKELKAEKLELLKPHSEIGLDYSTIGIGIFRVK